MSGNNFDKLSPNSNGISFHSRIGRTALEKILIPASIILLSGCVIFGVLFFTNRNSAGAVKETTAASSSQIIGDVTTQTGAVVTETSKASDPASASINMSSVGVLGATKPTASSKKATEAAAPATASTTAATEAATTPTTTETTVTGSAFFEIPEFSIPAIPSDFNIPTNIPTGVPTGVPTNTPANTPANTSANTPANVSTSFPVDIPAVFSGF